MGIDKTHTWEDRKSQYDLYYFVDYAGHIKSDGTPNYQLKDAVKRCEHIRDLFDSNITSFLACGCAHGSLVHGFSELDPTIHARGIDVSEFVISHSYLSIRNKLMVGDVTEGLPFDGGEFDLVTGFDILEHLYPYCRILNAVKEMCRVAKKWILLRQPMTRWEGEPGHGWWGWLETLNELPHRVRLTLVGTIPKLKHSQPQPEQKEHPSEHPRDFWIELFAINGFNLVDLPEEIYRLPNPNTFHSYNLLVFERM